MFKSHLRREREALRLERLERLELLGYLAWSVVVVVGQSEKVCLHKKSPRNKVADLVHPRSIRTGFVSTCPFISKHIAN